MLKYNIKLAVGTYSKLHKFVSFSTLKLQEKYCIKNYINIFFIKKIPGHRIFLFLRREWSLQAPAAFLVSVTS